MSNSVTDINIVRKIKYIEKDLIELRDIKNTLKNSMNSLTKYNKYITIKRIIGDMLQSFTDIENTIHMKEEMLKTLNIRKEHV
jgi:hypothetical protein